MMSEIPAWKLFEWKVFDELEPTHEERTEWGLARIIQALVNNGKPLADFQLPFGDRPGPAPVVQTLAYQEMVIDAWIASSNAALLKK